MYKRQILGGTASVNTSHNVDSTQGDNEFTPFRNIMNEWYAKDTSKKIRAVMKVKGNAGEHLTTNAPYGYMKDPDDSCLLYTSLHAQDRWDARK